MHSLRSTFRRLRGVSTLALLLLAVAACGKSDAKGTETAGAADSGVPAKPSLFDTLPDPTAAPKPTPPPAPVDPATVLVRVNGYAITQGEVDGALVKMFSFRGPIPPNEMPRIRQQLGPRVQDQLIDQKLLEQALEKVDFKPTEEAVAERWKIIEENLPPGTTLEEQLARSGLTRDEVDKKVREMLVLEGLLEPKAEGKPPTEADSKAFYDKNIESYRVQKQVRARHILLKTAPTDDDAKKAELKKKLEGLRAELTKPDGPAFEDVAKEHSTCPSSAQGGDLGQFTPGRMVPAFEKVAFELEPGIVSEIVETEFGYHLIKVDEKQDATTKPFEEVKSQILNQLRMRRIEKARKAFLAELRASAKIERVPAK